MTSPRGSRAVGRPAGGDDVTAAPSADAGQAEAMAAAAVPASGAPDQTPANGSSAEAVPASGSPAGTTVRGPSAGLDQQRAYQPGPMWARWLPPVVAFLVCLWGITTPSYWRDEAATIAAIKRPLGDLIAMLGNVDAVHGAYYLMMWPIEHVLGSGALGLRLPSAVAVAVGAAAVAAIARRLISPWAGLSAGLLYALLPVTSRYGQEARSYAMVMAVAAIASYLLIRVLGAEPARQRRWLAGYGASIAVLGILNIFGLLLIPAHAVTIALYGRRGVRDPAVRRLAIGWLAAVAAGVVIASPLLVLGWLQRGQIAWLSVNTSSSGLSTLYSLSGSYTVTTIVIAVIVGALVLRTEAGAVRRRAAWPVRLAEISLPWLIMPPLVLLVASTVQPVYTSRYILICIPALALIGGAAVASYSRIAGAIALVVILVAGSTTQAGERTAAGHYDDILAIDQIVKAHARPGDVVLYTNPNSESFGAAYSFGLGQLPNIALKQGPIQSRTLAGTNAPIAQIRSRLQHAKRVWVVEINHLKTAPQLLGLNGLPLSATPVLERL
ncbi:MAG TPA: glycosyltransferase family 39 protein, partial [Streptosporangiaceae bacterium]|nr:glycosyltransferase family 39 protein [Streptosporangiaceae bacterium]